MVKRTVSPALHVDCTGPTSPLMVDLDGSMLPAAASAVKGDPLIWMPLTRMLSRYSAEAVGSQTTYCMHTHHIQAHACDQG